MRKRKSVETPQAAPEAERPATPPWAQHLDDEERPNREDLHAGHNVFMDSMLGPVPMPRWLRGKRRQRDKLS